MIVLNRDERCHGGGLDAVLQQVSCDNNTTIVDPDEDEGDRSTSSSVDTADAFREMFGVRPQDMSLAADEIEIDEDDDGGRPVDDADVSDVTASSQEQYVTSRPVDLPPHCCRDDGAHHHRPPTAVFLDDVLRPTECAALVDRALRTPASFRYVTEATHTHRAEDGSVTRTVVPLSRPHDHKLAVFEDPVVSRRLWEDGLRPLFQRTPNPLLSVAGAPCGPATGLNPRLRVLKYDADDDDFFAPHYDATTSDGEHESRLTVLLYLNDDFEGGETVFLDRSRCDTTAQHTTANKSMDERHHTPVTPRAGGVLLFDHGLYHAGRAPTRGTKYVLRTDVMFQTPQQRCGDGDGLPERTPNDTTVASVAELCRKLRLTDAERESLRELDLLDTTIDSFCGPGPTVVTMILRESNTLSPAVVDTLVQEAFAIRDKHR